MKKILTVVGARPQFIKAAAVSRVLRSRFSEYLVHTGQHYDDRMSRIFFEEMEIPAPDVNLGVGSGGHGAQTGAMLAALEQEIECVQPDVVLIFGDTNSTLAAALAAAKLHVPVAHVEAGLRSFDRRMPEEINRVVADHLSQWLFCPGEAAASNLRAEGITGGVHIVGDVMQEALLWAADRAQIHSRILEERQLQPGRFLLATVHRAENTDDHGRLAAILRALIQLAQHEPVVFPVHPRTRHVLEGLRFEGTSGLRLIEPLGYLDMVRATSAARVVLTDSGGLQKEAYWLGVPCITLRDTTEWGETVSAGWNTVAGADSVAIVSAAQNARPPTERPVLYGDPRAAERCMQVLEQSL